MPDKALELLEQEGSARDLDYNLLKIEIHSELGIKEYKNKNFEKSLEYFNQVIKDLPNWAFPYNQIGLIYMGTDNEKAIENFEKAITVSDNKFAAAYYNLGYIYFSQKENDKAKQYYDMACKLGPQEDFTYYD